MGYIRIDKGRKDMRILWRESYREKGKVKKKEYLISTKGQITYYLPLWYIFIGFINETQFNNELIKFWIKVRGIDSYVSYSMDNKKIKFTGKEKGIDLRQKYFVEELKIIREKIKEWENEKEKFNSLLKESVYDILDRLWYSLRELEDYKKQGLTYSGTKDYLKFFIHLAQLMKLRFYSNPCLSSFEVLKVSLILWGIGNDCNDKATDIELKQEAWIRKDNYISSEQNRLMCNKNIILKNIEAINNFYAPEKKESINLFREKVLKDHPLPNL